MRIIVLYCIIFCACFISLQAQKTVPGLMPKDTVSKNDSVRIQKTKDTTSNNNNVHTPKKKIFDIQEVLDAEISFGIGWGEYGYTYPFSLRYKHIGISMISPFKREKMITNYIDKPPPNDNYTLVLSETPPLIFSVEYSFGIIENLYVFPSIGFSRTANAVIPLSNVLPIYYKPQSEREIISFCYGIGAEYYIRLEKRVAIGIQAAHRNIIGTTFTVGIAFSLIPRREY